MRASVGPAVVAELARRYGPLDYVGAGAWSSAYSLRRDGQLLVVRVGEHVEDFEVDAEMAAYRSEALPIPEVFELTRLGSPHDSLYACVSSFAAGTPLEQAGAAEWPALVPRVADLLEAMRAVTPPTSAMVPTWPALLLEEPPDAGRQRGWRKRLGARAEHLAGYHAARHRLGELCAQASVVEVEATLLHCDLVNRNVHVADGEITGVFDWGCRRWGDHLYDVAWFVFWEPWLGGLDVELLVRELATRWGGGPDGERLAACLLHIGADHLIYNALVGDRRAGDDVLARMIALGLIGAQGPSG